MKIFTVPRFSGRIAPFFSVNGRLRACLFDLVSPMGSDQVNLEANDLCR